MHDFYRRHLPHYQPANGTFFVTFRLAGTLPISKLDRLARAYAITKRKIAGVPQRELRSLLLHEARTESFLVLDEELARSRFNRSWLSKPEIAEVVEESLTFMNSSRANIHAWTIMPNHVHLVFSIGKGILAGPGITEWQENPSLRYPVAQIIGSLKKYSARRANRILNRSGHFWQTESYDHFVRNAEELSWIVRYILLNPVRANLVASWQEWRWTYCSREFDGQ